MKFPLYQPKPGSKFVGAVRYYERTGGFEWTTQEATGLADTFREATEIARGRVRPVESRPVAEERPDESYAYKPRVVSK